MRALAIDLDGALGDTRPLWRDWVGDLSRRTRTALDLPQDRAAAAARLDELVGNWPALLERFAEDRAPVYLRPDAQVSAALRRLAADGVRLGVFTDAPEPLALVALAHLGAARRVEAVETGRDALERLVERFGSPLIVRTREELAVAADANS